MPADERRDERAIREAARWYAALLPRASDADLLEQWRGWLAADPAHERAWQRVLAFSGRLEPLSGPVAAAVLARAGTRRGALRLLAGLGAGLAGSALALRGSAYAPHDGLLWTATGERHERVLPDGTRLALDAGTHAELRYDAQQRRLVLGAGALWIETGPDARPFFVDTPAGRLQPLGTRFVVRVLPQGRVRVAVSSHAVRVQPAGLDASSRVPAGSAMTFSAGASGLLTPSAGDEDVWRSGRLSVVDAPLADWVAVLAAYRPGYLGCAPAAAGLRVSGVYPLADTDAALELLVAAFPLRIERRTRYWTRIVSR
ncbi:DUF4880 domain-containing protein [Verticiella sediminum]|uniref:DUF4880 domain-containing protein n=1 Tax=Verticiella sediminum TaxID=1247510 RepID=A0A556AIL4_9BURK|nr:FecR domain-containing protein [Verticiella sediminum]TSH92728.1 DUF4880 domain-containing protein [Verticiella sediminum]